MARSAGRDGAGLARQIVRSELEQRPAAIAAVAAEAVEALLLSARHVTLRVHPDDHALVAQGAGRRARGARCAAHRRRDDHARRLPRRVRHRTRRRERRDALAACQRAALGRELPWPVTPPGRPLARQTEADDERSLPRPRRLAPARGATPAATANWRRYTRRSAELRRRAAAARDPGPARARHRPRPRSRRHPRARRFGVRRAHVRTGGAAGRSGGLFRRLRLPHADRRSAWPGERCARRAATFARRCRCMIIQPDHPWRRRRATAPVHLPIGDGLAKPRRRSATASPMDKAKGPLDQCAQRAAVAHRVGQLRSTGTRLWDTARHRRARDQCPADGRARPAHGPVRRQRRRQKRAARHDGALHQRRRDRRRPDRRTRPRSEGIHREHSRRRRPGAFGGRRRAGRYAAADALAGRRLRHRDRRIFPRPGQARAADHGFADPLCDGAA